jgi:hypothetical protein
MDDYTQQLEKQLEELQERLTLASIWKPIWKRHDEDHWVYCRGPVSYGKIDRRHGMFYASCVSINGSFSEYKTLTDAQAHVELYVIECLRKEEA